MGPEVAGALSGGKPLALGLGFLPGGTEAGWKENSRGGVMGTIKLREDTESRDASYPQQTVAIS